MRWLLLAAAVVGGLPLAGAAARAPALVQAPLGPPIPPDGNPLTPAKANLGKALFFDEQLSSTRTVACATCHRAGHGGGDPRAARGVSTSVHPGADGTFGTPDDVVASRGVPRSLADGSYAASQYFGLREQVTARKSLPVLNAAYAPVLFGDGRAASRLVDPVTGGVVLAADAALESQAISPPIAADEMAHDGRDWTQVVRDLEAAEPLALSPAVPLALDAWIAGRSYPELFEEAFGSPGVTAPRVAMAIASYERTLISNLTPFDAFLSGEPALTFQELVGRALFAQLNCRGCHSGTLLSDHAFHYLGVRPAGDDPGRFAVTGIPSDRGAFRTPGLRNVASRGPYFHDGRFATLEEVVDFYDRGGDFDAPHKDPAIVPLGLTAEQKQDLVAFLKRPLTDPRIAAGEAPFDEPALYSDSPRVPRLVGNGTSGTGGRIPRVVAIEPPFAGNPNFTVGVDDALGGALAVLVIDWRDPGIGPTPRSGALLRVTVPLTGLGAGRGSGSTSVALPATAGVSYTGRWYVNDPGAAGGVAVSAAFRFELFAAGARNVGPGVPRARAAVLRSIAPNPFNPETTIGYELATDATLHLEIFDVRGRRVRILVDGSHLAGGPGIARWDGRDDAGRPLASGVYVVRIEAGGASDARRAVLLK